MNRKLLTFAGALAVAGLAAPSWGQIIVRQDGNGDATTIEGGLLLAGVGEEVRVVDSGTYAEAVNVVGRRLTSVPTGATIQGNVSIAADLPAEVAGFTIQGTGVLIGISNRPEVLLKDLVVSGGETGAYIVDAATVAIEDCDFVDQTIRAIRIEDLAAAPTTAADITISGSGISSSAAGVTRGIEVLRNLELAIEDSTFGGWQRAIEVFPAGQPPNDIGYNITLDNTVVDGMRESNNNQGAVVLNNRTTFEMRNGSVISDSGSNAIQVNNAAATDTVIRILDSSLVGNNTRGIDTQQRAVIEVAGSDISGNGGDGITIRGSAAGTTLEIADSTLDDNGQDAVNSNRVFTMEAARSTFNGNTRDAYNVSNAQSDGSVLSMEDCEVEGNGRDGLFFARQVNATVTGTSFRNNGRFAIQQNANNAQPPVSLVIQGCLFENHPNNQVAYRSGFNADTLVVEDSIFRGPTDRNLTVENTGGGPGTMLATIRRNHFVSSNTTSSVNVLLWDTAPGSIFENNLVERGREMLFLNRGHMDVFHNTLAHSGERDPSYGIFVNDFMGHLDIRNNIISDVQFAFGSQPTTNVDNMLVDFNLLDFFGEAPVEPVAGDPLEGLIPLGPNNLVGASPGYAAYSIVPGEGDYSLQLGSAAIGAGDPTVPTDEDINGDERPQPAGSDPDLGAYEMPTATRVDDWMRMPH